MREISLTRGKVALVDDEDYERLSKYKWSLNSAANLFYARGWIPGEDGVKSSQMYMHGFILSVPVGFEVDHINGDGLDNQKSNLRVVSHRENCQNRHQLKTSRFPGVRKRRNVRTEYPWSAQIQISKKIVYLGVFRTEIEAAEAYEIAVGRVKEGLPLNLRPVVLRPSKTSKYIGVNWCESRKRWVSRIQVGGKAIYLGRFVLEENAHAAREDAENKYRSGFEK